MISERTRPDATPRWRLFVALPVPRGRRRCHRGLADRVPPCVPGCALATSRAAPRDRPVPGWRPSRGRGGHRAGDRIGGCDGGSAGARDRAWWRRRAGPRRLARGHVADPRARRARRALAVRHPGPVAAARRARHTGPAPATGRPRDHRAASLPGLIRALRDQALGPTGHHLDRGADGALPVAHGHIVGLPVRAARGGAPRGPRRWHDRVPRPGGGAAQDVRPPGRAGVARPRGASGPGPGPAGSQRRGQDDGREAAAGSHPPVGWLRRGPRPAAGQPRRTPVDRLPARDVPVSAVADRQRGAPPPLPARGPAGPDVRGPGAPGARLGRPDGSPR